MPIYEYRCTSCSQKSSIFARSVSSKVEAVCPRCGSVDMQRIISTVAFRRSAGSSPGMDYYKDSSNIGRRVEEGYKRFGVDMPDSVRKSIDEARKGKTPQGLDL